MKFKPQRACRRNLIGYGSLAMKILVVEDEMKTACYLDRGLKENGFVVDLVHDGEDGLHMASQGDYDFVIVDVTSAARWLVTHFGTQARG